MNDLVKMANIAKVKANLAAGMPMMAAIKKAYPDYTPDQVKALAAQMGGMGKMAGYGKALKTGKAKKYMKKKKLAHALMQKIAYEGRVPPASLITPQKPIKQLDPSKEGPGLKMVGKTRGTVLTRKDGTPMGPVGRPMVAGGGDPIFKRVPTKVKPRKLPTMPKPAPLKASYAKQ